MRLLAINGAILFAAGINAMILPWKAPDAKSLKLEGGDPMALISAVPSGGAFDRTGWVLTADSEQAGNGRYNALDGNNNTFWHTEYSPTTAQLPHTMTIDMKVLKYVDGITYLPRQDNYANGNIGQHNIYLSTDGVNFGNPVAYGTWYDDQTIKSSAFELQPARYVKIVAITEAGNRGPWSSAAEFNVYGDVASAYVKPNPTYGLWGPTIDFPIVPVSAAVAPDSGNLQTWSSYAPNGFWGIGGPGETLTSEWNFATKLVSQRLVTNTNHDMFCSGISVDGSGRVIVTGGDSDSKMSIYTSGAENWAAGPDMQLLRAYNSQVTLGDGRIFDIGGSWDDVRGGKNGEIYSPAKNTWTLLPGAAVANMLTADNGGIYRQDNHAWLFNWKNTQVFQAGPSKQMNWYSVAGNGGVTSAGTRGSDTDAMCGNAVMYDAAAGKILTVGGSTDYVGSPATRNANIITLGTPPAIPQVQGINPMWYARIFGNSVVLPTGQVFICGGQTVGDPFYEDGSILTPEIWSPTNNQFVRMTPNRTPRVYHSIALLLIDATVINCGSGLCTDCSTNHFDCQIFTPPYLLNADGSLKSRVTINNINRINLPGATVTITTSGPVVSFSMIRFSSTTHTVNTDQRRIVLTPTQTGTNTYKVTLGPNDIGVVTPGYYMVFAIDSAGTPSKGYTIKMNNYGNS